MRRILKWAGVGICALILTAWGWSLFASIIYTIPIYPQSVTPPPAMPGGVLVSANCKVHSLQDGVIMLNGWGGLPPGAKGGWQLFPVLPIAQLRHGLVWPQAAPPDQWFIPLWVLLVPVATPTALLIVRDVQRSRRRRIYRYTVPRPERLARLAVTISLFCLVLFLTRFLLETAASCVAGDDFIDGLGPSETFNMITLLAISLVIPYVVARLAYGRMCWRRVRSLDPLCPKCLHNLRGNISGMCPACREAVTPYCPFCGYNLTGNVSGVCPECGTAAIPPKGGVSRENAAANSDAFSNGRE